MVSPLPSGYGVTTRYGIRGRHWSCRKNSAGGIHTGVDYAAPTGTPVYATIGGDVRYRNYGSAFGSKQIAISPDAGMFLGNGEVFYAHLSWRVANGTRVKPGDLVGKVGSEGNVTGPHLHYEAHSAKGTWSCGVIIDPMPSIQQGGGGGAPAPKWKHPDGTKVYQKYLRFKGHEQNDDNHSTSIECWQEMLNSHPLSGGVNLPVTGKWLDMTEAENIKDQSQHIPPADPVGQSFVGPGQFDHVKKSVGAPYVFVKDSTPPPKPPDPPSTGVPGEPELLAPGAVWDPVSGMGGLRPFRGDALKIVLHTTESAGKPDWQAKRSGLPHFTADLVNGKVWQHLQLGTMAAYTLNGGDNSPNSDAGFCYQVEIVGFAEDSPGWSDEEYNNLHVLLRWIVETMGVPYEFPVGFAGRDKARRLSWPEFEGINGILGHSHVPYNDHWDPGALDVSRLVEVPETVPPPIKPPPVESGSARDLLLANGWGDESDDEIDTALAVMWCESHGYIDAVGDLGLINDKWGPSVGLPQIRTLQEVQDWEGQPDGVRDIDALRDPGEQVKAMQVLKNQYGWQQWSTHPDSAERKGRDPIKDYECFHEAKGKDFPLRSGHENAACWSLDGCDDGTVPPPIEPPPVEPPIEPPTTEMGDPALRMLLSKAASDLAHAIDNLE